MRAYVFTDAALARYAGRFVWLSVDTENATNAAFLRKFPIRVWPTMLVVDAKHDSTVMNYSGGATVPQLSHLLDQAERTFRAKSLSESDRLLAQADTLTSAEKTAEATELYAKAIANAPPKWAQLGRAAESYTLTLQLDHKWDRCATESFRLYPLLAGTTSGASVAASGVACVTELPPDFAHRAEMLRTFEEASRAALDDPKMPLSGDDRSGLYDALVSAREDAKDEAGAHALREQWIHFLEHEAETAKTPEQRAVYDSHRVALYIELKTPEKAIPMLQQSARDFPNDYNPHARLALAYKAMGRFQDAIAASDVALSKVYGPRKIGVYRTRYDIFKAMGDEEAAKKTLQEAIRYAKDLPLGQRNDRTIAALEKMAK